MGVGVGSGGATVAPGVTVTAEVGGTVASGVTVTAEVGGTVAPGGTVTAEVGGTVASGVTVSEGIGLPGGVGATASEGIAEVCFGTRVKVDVGLLVCGGRAVDVNNGVLVGVGPLMGVLTEFAPPQANNDTVQSTTPYLEISRVIGHQALLLVEIGKN